MSSTPNLIIHTDLIGIGVKVIIDGLHLSTLKADFGHEFGLEKIGCNLNAELEKTD
ncbi:hypothetical protein [Aquibacillus rhizosphaerae]|uniref:Uncharacterized protein n=1 Tax=Aquibacillus rhizosphaerae TaxID=3051431 RepID=A0ABT7LA03_9BACI|nr:hypothetical protein [Aquibacillus sp. LR5S19]MDL4842694.1 hypothetical protein [Aquibacillus sp. LR5S19]